MSEIDYAHPRGLKKNIMASLATGDWMLHQQNLLITGPCGSGKSYIACALGHHKCWVARVAVVVTRPYRRVSRYGVGFGSVAWCSPVTTVNGIALIHEHSRGVG